MIFDDPSLGPTTYYYESENDKGSVEALDDCDAVYKACEQVMELSYCDGLLIVYKEVTIVYGDHEKIDLKVIWEKDK